jgi:GTP pyrophosphokinase
MVAHALTFSPDDAESWLASLEERYNPEQRQILKQATDWLADHGGEEISDTGESVITHSLGTAAVLAGMRFDAETVAAALLCGLPEKALKRETLLPRFGPHLTALVEGAAKLSRMDHLFTQINAEGGQSETLRQMLLAMTDDIRVVFIKLAERTQALRELADQDESRRRKVATDVRELYAPLANRLGVWQLKWELEDLSCRYLEPDTYRQIARQLDERRLDREWYIEQVIKDLGAALQADGRHQALGERPAQAHRQHPGQDAQEAPVLRRGLRRARRARAGQGREGLLPCPRPGAQPVATDPRPVRRLHLAPKGNGYKSLHTAVVGPENKALEVQIRTFDMHREAELGVAAHWRYKEGGNKGAGGGDGVQDKISWLRQLLAWKQELADSHELAQHFRNELFQDEVFVLTPQGKVVALPSGATPLDFAYAVHTELGHRCRGAKVDGSWSPWIRPGHRPAGGNPHRQAGRSQPGLAQSASGRAQDPPRPLQGAPVVQAAGPRYPRSGRPGIAGSGIASLNLSNVNLDKTRRAPEIPRPGRVVRRLGRGDVGSGQLDRALQDEFVPPPENPWSPPPRRRPMRVACWWKASPASSPKWPAAVNRRRRTPSSATPPRATASPSTGPIAL